MALPNHPTADQIAVEFGVVDNHQDGANSFKAALTLINNGTVDLGHTGWTLYFNFVRMPIPESIPDAGRQNILGIQGQLWAESAKGPTVMEHQAFPKVLGLAERAWAAQPAWARVEDPAARKAQLAAAWNRFANSLGRHALPQLDYLYGGVAYRLPPPGAVVEDGLLKANTAFPGLTLRYTTDGTEPTASSTRYEGPVAITRTAKIKTFDTRGRGSRTTVVSE